MLVGYFSSAPFFFSIFHKQHLSTYTSIECKVAPSQCTLSLSLPLSFLPLLSLSFTLLRCTFNPALLLNSGHVWIMRINRVFPYRMYTSDKCNLSPAYEHTYMYNIHTYPLYADIRNFWLSCFGIRQFYCGESFHSCTSLVHFQFVLLAPSTAESKALSFGKRKLLAAWTNFDYHNHSQRAIHTVRFSVFTNTVRQKKNGRRRRRWGHCRNETIIIFFIQRWVAGPF